MNRYQFRISKPSQAGVLAFSALIMGLSFAAFAYADVAPTITTTVLSASNATTTSAQIGTIVHDMAVVAGPIGSTTPTGTVDFTLFATANCSGATSTQSGVALVNGVANSATTTVSNTGLSYKVHYNGQTDSFIAMDGQCEPVIATSSGATIATVLSATSVVVGASVNDTATLSGTTASATGTVAYKVFTDNACSAGMQSAGLKTVASSTVPNSDSIPFNTVGTFYWQAVFSGDMNNIAATSSCQSEILTVLATSTPGTATISGKVYNDANNNETKDAGEAGIAGFTINLYGQAGWWTSKKLAPIMSAVTDVNGNYSFSNLADGTYSIEEINQAGWMQDTSDFKSVVIAGGVPMANLDIGNTQKSGGGNICFPPRNDGGSGNNGNHDGQNNDGRDGDATTTQIDSGNHHDQSNWSQTVTPAVVPVVTPVELPVTGSNDTMSHHNQRDNGNDNSSRGRNGRRGN